MDINIKTETLGEITSVVNLSSDEEDLAVSPQNSEIATIKQPERPRTPETNCSICLEELNNKCYSDSCWHLFCFDCLKRWSAIQPSCPLCKKEFKCIYHAFTDQGVHETFDVPNRVSEFSSRTYLYSHVDSNSMFRMNLFLDIVRRNERFMNNLTSLNPEQPEDPRQNLIHTAAQYINLHPRILPRLAIPNNDNLYNGRRIPPGQTMRMRVYVENLWADPLPDLSGRFRECSYTFYRDNPTQTYRLLGFITRDLDAIRAIERTEGLRSSGFILGDGSLVDVIMQTILSYDIRDTFVSNMLRPYIGTHSSHFLHELYNYAHSPYDLIGYDRNVRYSIRPVHPVFYQSGLSVSDVFEETPTVPISVAVTPSPRIYSETIVLDTDDEEEDNNSRLYGQEVIIVSSADENDSDVEILSHTFQPLETLDSSRDQPSTSTGIRDSLDRTNNRYNLRRRRLFSPIISSTSCPVHLSRMTYPASLRRGRITLDSSSSDDDSLNPTHGSQTMHIKSEIVIDKKKRKIKKKKLRKRKKNVDGSRPELPIGSRSRSNSGSSSSYSDTDIRPNNNRLPLGTNILL